MTPVGMPANGFSGSHHDAVRIYVSSKLILEKLACYGDILLNAFNAHILL